MHSKLNLGKTASIATLLLMSAFGQAQNSPIVVEVKDNSGRILSDARVTLVGPEKSRFNTVVLQSDRLGIATFNNNFPGKYLVVASKQDYQLQLKEFTISNSQPGHVELRLGPNTSEKIVVCARNADTGEVINGATVEVQRGNDRGTQPYTTRGNGLTTIPTHSSPTVRYNLQISHPDYEPASAIVQSDAGMDRFTTFLLRRRSSNRPDVARNAVPLHGDIRMKKDRLKSGEVATADVGVYYSDSQALSLPTLVSVKVFGPSGRIVASDAYTSTLQLNAFSRKSLDIPTFDPGIYTIRATATGNGMKTWTSDKTFTVDRQVAGPIVAEGIYNGTIDLTNIAGQIQTHTMSIKVSKKAGNLYDVTGSVGPGQADGFHIQFSGTFDVRRGNLSAIGDLKDNSNTRWDIRLSGPINQAGRLQLVLSIRARDNSYNRAAKTQLAKI